MAKLYNLARMSTATTGAGTLTLGSAIAGFLTFAQAGVQDGDTVAYAIRDGNNSETGTGVYTSSGTTLSRTPVTSTNGNAAINLSGAAQVIITALAADIANLREANTFTGAQTFNSTINGTTIDNLAWSTTNPTVTTTGGTLTSYTVTVHSKQLGRLVFVWGELVITTVGTATGELKIPLPVDCIAAGAIGNAWDRTNGNGLGQATGKGGCWIANTGPTSLVIHLDGNPILATVYNFSIVYESAAGQ